jgi:hypothetical protein
MVIQELSRLPLDRIKWQIHINQLRGDRKSFYDAMWGDYHSGIASYEKTLQGVLNNPIKDLLKDRKNPVVVDLMSPTWALYDLFSELPCKEKLGLSVSLEDLRTNYKKRKDKKLNIIQIAGDLLKASTWAKIEEKLDGRKADLIMERAMSGFDCIPRDTRLYGVLLNKAWSLLGKDGGILIAQVPQDFKDQAKKMINEFRKNKEMDALGGESTRFYYSIKLVKTPNSPENLSF